MSRAHDKPVQDAERPAAAPEGEPPGKVVVDSRGRNVWQWAKDVLENTSVLLKRLENKDLALESTQKVPIVSGHPGEQAAGPKAARRGESNAKAAKDASTKSRQWHPAMKADPKSDRGGGFDPYNSR